MNSLSKIASRFFYVVRNASRLNRFLSAAANTGLDRSRSTDLYIRFGEKLIRMETILRQTPVDVRAAFFTPAFAAQEDKSPPLTATQVTRLFAGGIKHYRAHIMTAPGSENSVFNAAFDRLVREAEIFVSWRNDADQRLLPIIDELYRSNDVFPRHLCNLIMPTNEFLLKDGTILIKLANGENVPYVG